MKPDPKPVAPEPAKPTPLKIIKVDDADLQPQNTLEDDDIAPQTGSQVKIKKIDGNFFGLGGNKKPSGGNNPIDKIQNGITFMGSQIASFNEVPTINSKIVLPNRFGGGGGVKPPSIGKFDKFPFPPPFGKPGKAPSMSKIFDPNVNFYFLDIII